MGMRADELKKLLEQYEKDQQVIKDKKLAAEAEAKELEDLKTKYEADQKATTEKKFEDEQPKPEDPKKEEPKPEEKKPEEPKKEEPKPEEKKPEEPKKEEPVVKLKEKVTQFNREYEENWKKMEAFLTEQKLEGTYIPELLQRTSELFKDIEKLEKPLEEALAKGVLKDIEARLDLIAKILEKVAKEKKAIDLQLTDFHINDKEKCLLTFKQKTEVHNSHHWYDWFFNAINAVKNFFVTLCNNLQIRFSKDTLEQFKTKFEDIQKQVLAGKEELTKERIAILKELYKRTDNAELSEDIKKAISKYRQDLEKQKDLESKLPTAKRDYEYKQSLSPKAPEKKEDKKKEPEPQPAH